MNKPFDKEEVLNILINHIGAKNAASAGELVREITSSDSNAVSERLLRYKIRDLRLDGFHVCAHPATGYYMAANEAELNKTCEFLYDRAMASLTQVSKMKRISLPDLRGQLQLLS